MGDEVGVGVNDSSAFTDDENWTGGFYELAVELGDRDDHRLDAAISAAWADPWLTGPFAARDHEASAQERVAPSLATQETTRHLRGLAQLPTGPATVCGSVIIREERGTDWFDFYLPVGALARADSRVGAYPFGAMMTVGDQMATTDSLVWRGPIDRWLATMAKRIFEVAPFRLGLIGWEMSGTTSAAEIDAVPEERYMTYLVPEDHGLAIYEATI